MTHLQNFFFNPFSWLFESEITRVFRIKKKANTKLYIIKILLMYRNKNMAVTRITKIWSAFHATFS